MARGLDELYNIFLTRREAYLLFLAKEETDTSKLPKPLTEEEEALYNYCVTSATAMSTRTTDIASAKNWATKTDAAVADGEYSAKYYALLAKDWATKTSAAVADGEYSAKYYASAASTSATAAAGSADLASDWAVKMDGKVNDEDYSAKYYAEQAAEAAGGGDVDPDSGNDGGGE